MGKVIEVKKCQYRDQGWRREGLSCSCVIVTPPRRRIGGGLVWEMIIEWQWVIDRSKIGERHDEGDEIATRTGRVADLNRHGAVY